MYTQHKMPVQRNSDFSTNSNFLIPMSLQPYVVDVLNYKFYDISETAGKD